MKRVLAKIHLGLAWVIVAVVIAQFFLAGLGIFRATSFTAHQRTGYLAIGLTLVLLLLALAGWLGGLRIGLSALLLVLTIIQSLLPKGPSLVAALHPVNALLILGVAVMLAQPGTMIGTRSRAADPVPNLREGR